MDLNLLRSRIAAYKTDRYENAEKHLREDATRREHKDQIRRWTRVDILNLDAEGVYRYLAPLWAMLIWGNKAYAVDKLVDENGVDRLRTELSELIWSEAPVAARWNRFRKSIKGIGPAMMSEILCHMHPDTCPIWNRRARAGLVNVGVEGLPKHDYQVTGENYELIGKTMWVIGKELTTAGFSSVDLLTVDYFIRDQLQSEVPLIQQGKLGQSVTTAVVTAGKGSETAEFIHNEVRDKLADIGEWLGFKTGIEKKVADGSVVDTIWQATIGNMGRVIYVFEVQTKGSVDSLIVNLLKSLNNPAVQGVVAVSGVTELERIKRHAADVRGLADKLKCWDYEEVLKVHASLEAVNESINQLDLVPQGFVA